ncbi:DUF5709 domain-containing protein [Catenuloplanes atrovinosus]|uniref:DUF5709 domain-containing protein n=1 Tax=Catenuloplanes atrovinosus TaxID=137266 RepID=A0AAE4C875_9ACTN|nr:DUF5709 domain-containing protein [Catenuloplanes atrovinosus]MDR7274362.1 hypothetical protein [Catenuloplanes atrovinosus]
MTDGPTQEQADRELWLPENDEGQLSADDTLSDRGLDDDLDEGYSPPERYRGATAFGVTAEEARQGESLDDRLRQEVPDSSGDEPSRDALDDGEGEESDEFYDAAETGDRRAGRLVAPDEGAGEDTEDESWGSDVGIDGGAASAEEAAVHIVDNP